VEAVGTPQQSPQLSAAPDLLGWAKELAERDVTLPSAVAYEEKPGVRFSTNQVSYYAGGYRKTITESQHFQGQPNLYGRRSGGANGSLKL
jgi:hypothetical protein